MKITREYNMKLPYHPHRPGIQSHSFWRCQCFPWVCFHWRRWGEASVGCKRDENASVTCVSAGNVSIRFLRYELLPLKNRVLLQHLKVVLLICGMLVDYKEVRVQFGDDEAQIKLTNDLHVFKHFFAVDEDDTIYCSGTFSALLPSFARVHFWN